MFSEFRVLLQPEIKANRLYLRVVLCLAALSRQAREEARQVHQRYACLLARSLWRSPATRPGDIYDNSHTARHSIA